MMPKFCKNPWNSYLGDCSIVDQYLLDKPVNSVKWFIPHFLNVLLRAVGQPAFVNNPISGLIICIALFMLPDWRIGGGMILGGSVATLSEMVLKIQPWTLMRTGVAPCSGILVGVVFAALYPSHTGCEMDTRLIVFICIGSFASIFISASFYNTLGRANIPYLALPYNLIAVCAFLTLRPNNSHKMEEDFNHDQELDSYAGGNLTTNDVDWTMVGRGIAVSMGQLYAINDIPCSSLINIAVFLASPLLFSLSAIGAALGSLGGVALLNYEELPEVYDGLWGFNGIVAMTSLGCVYFAFGSLSFLLGLLNVVASVCVQFALRANMTIEDKIPVFSMPMTLATLVLVNVSDSRGILYRVEDTSYPEKQAYDWHTRTKVSTTNNTDEEAIKN